MLSDNIYYVILVHKVYGLMQGDLPTAGALGSNQHGVSGTQPTQAKRDAGAILARLKRDHPDLAQQVINGDVSAIRAAREE